MGTKGNGMDSKRLGLLEKRLLEERQVVLEELGFFDENYHDTTRSASGCVGSPARRLPRAPSCRARSRSARGRWVAPPWTGGPSSCRTPGRAAQEPWSRRRFSAAGVCSA